MALNHRYLFPLIQLGLGSFATFGCSAPGAAERVAIEAKGELSDGNVAAAAKLAKTSLTGATRKHAYPNYVDAAVQVAKASPTTALAAYENALSGPEPAGAIYAEAAAGVGAGEGPRAAPVPRRDRQARRQARRLRARRLLRPQDRKSVV